MAKLNRRPKHMSPYLNSHLHTKIKKNKKDIVAAVSVIDIVCLCVCVFT